MSVGSIQFQLDEHLGKEVVDGLRRFGIEARTTAEAGYRGLPDDQLLERCRLDGTVMVTFDDDYLKLHHRQVPHRGIVYCGRKTRATGGIVAALVAVHAAYTPVSIENWVEYV